MAAKFFRGAFVRSHGLTRAALEHELRRRGWLQDGRHVARAWGVGLLGLKINDVDCTKREAGGIFMRAMAGDPATSVNSVIGLTDTQLLLHTSARLYSAGARNVVLVRCSEDAVELGWLSPKMAPEDPAARLIPEGAFALDDLDLFMVRLQAFDAAEAKQIAESVTELRARFLAAAEPRLRAMLEETIQMFAELPFG